MSHTTKLIAILSLTISLSSCKEEPENTVKEEPQVIPVKEQSKLEKPKQSPLEQQIMLMLAGNEGNQAVLRHAVETIEWKIILKTWKDGIKTYQIKHGKKPEKKYIVRIHSILSLIQSEVKLADVKARKKQSLKDLEDTIKSAIEKEREKKQ